MILNYTLFKGKTFLITGATGLVGKCMIRKLIEIDEEYNLGLRIIAVGRNKKKFSDRFCDIPMKSKVEFLEHDIQNPLIVNERVDYIVSMASNTHPRLYSTDPIGTEMTNILGTYNLLELASLNSGCRFLLASSGDVYGDNIYNDDFIKENDCGYIDCNSLRAGYIEGKRASEALCNAFKEDKNVDFVIARLCRIYGKDMQLTDSKAISQFILNAVKKNNIVLKSEGKPVFSYLIVDDAVSAILTILINGKSGDAYNVADNGSVISLKNLAMLIAKIAEVDVLNDIPDLIESKGASTFMNVKLDGTKLKSLGWQAEFDLEKGLTKTINELRDLLC